MHSTKLSLPNELLQLLDRLHQAGHKAYAVGGGVRDIILERPIKDWDVATSAPPEQVMRLFPHTVPTGLKHGTVTVLAEGTPPQAFEVTTFRTDGTYSDTRRPDSVEFVANIEDDLARRDFTVNALAYDPRDARLIDLWGGVSDLRRRCIRTVGNPDQRFKEDGLRLLRAARFAAQLGFTVEASTRAAMRRRAQLIKKISAERVRDELTAILLSPRPSMALKLLRDVGILQFVLPELTRNKSALSSALQRLNLLAASKAPASASLATRLAAIFPSPALLRRLRFSNREMHDVATLQRHLRSARDCERDDATSLRRRFAEVGADLVPALLELQLVCQAPKKLLQWKRAAEALLAHEQVLGMRQLAIDGGDVMQVCNQREGSEIGKVLRESLELVWEEPGLNVKEALTQWMIERWRDDLR